MRLLLLLTSLFALSLTQAGADEPSGGEVLPIPDVERDKNGLIVVRVGTIGKLKLGGDKRPTEIVSSNDPVLGARLSPSNPAELILYGKAIGNATLTIIYTDKSKVVYDVVVDQPRCAGGKRLSPGYLLYSLALTIEDSLEDT